MYEDVTGRIRGRLLTEPMPLEQASPLNPDWVPDVAFNDPPVPAAVLIALVHRQAGLTVLYTERTAHLRAHSGQVAFPGGKLDPDDRDVATAALREAAEEVALDPGDAEVLGYMPPVHTGTNYIITPVVASVDPRKPFVPNPAEVDEIFEVPMALIADVQSYGEKSAILRGRRRTTWQIDFGGHVIWGITAHLTRRFRAMALAEAA